MDAKAILPFLIVLAFAACGSGTAEYDRPGAAANKPEPAATAAANVNTDAVPQPSAPSGTKVTAASDYKFDSAGIPAGWTWIDPAASEAPIRYDTSGGKLRFRVPGGRDMFGENRTAPHMLQAIEGDFQIETRVTVDPRSDYQGAGLFVYLDGNNYLRLERGYGGVDGTGSGIRLDARTPYDYRAITTPDEVVTAAKTVDLKLLRIGKKFIAFWRLDEESEWREVGEFDSDYPDTVQVGIIACNTGKEMPVEFSYIKLAPQI